MQILDENKLNKLSQIEKVKVLNCGCGTTECKVEGLPQYNWDEIFKEETEKKKKQIDNANPLYGAGVDEEEKQELSNGLPVPKLF